MPADTAIKVITTAANPELSHFDDRTALHLTQAFNQEETLEGLLALLLSQMSALCGTQGLTYKHDSLGVEYRLGRKATHHASYRLKSGKSDVGEVILYRPVRANEQEIRTAEDLLSLGFSALRHLIDLALARAASDEVTAQSADAIKKVRDTKADALVLLALDGYRGMVARTGAEWTQILLQAVLDRIKDGLRQADGVYQIEDDTIAVLLPNTDRDQAREVAQKIRVLVSSLHLSGETEGGQITASMGISDASTGSTAEEVMDHARLALAQARDQGHNSLVMYQAD